MKCRFIVDQIIGTLQDTGASVLHRHEQLPGEPATVIVEAKRERSVLQYASVTAFSSNLTQHAAAGHVCLNKLSRAPKG